MHIAESHLLRSSTSGCGLDRFVRLGPRTLYARRRIISVPSPLLNL